MLARCKRLLDRIGTVERGLGIALILYMVGAITVQVFTAMPSAGRSRGSRNRRPTPSSGCPSSAPASG
jgi:hypothetical protein